MILHSLASLKPITIFYKSYENVKPGLPSSWKVNSIILTTLPLFPSTESEDGYPKLRSKMNSSKASFGSSLDHSFSYHMPIFSVAHSVLLTDIINICHLRSSCPQNRLFISFGRRFLFLDPKLCFLLLICGTSWSMPFHKLHSVISAPSGEHYHKLPIQEHLLIAQLQNKNVFQLNFSGWT